MANPFLYSLKRKIPPMNIHHLFERGLPRVKKIFVANFQMIFLTNDGVKCGKA